MDAASLAGLEKKPRRSVMLAAGIGCAGGALLFEALLGPHGLRAEWGAWRIITFLPATVIVVWISLRFFHPFYERLNSESQAPVAGDPHQHFEFHGWMWGVALAGGILETLLHVALWEGYERGWATLLGGLVYGSVITRYLAIGYRRRPKAAARLGGTAGFITGCLMAALPALDYVYPSQTATQVVWTLIVTIGPVGLQVGLMGFFAGLFLDNLPPDSGHPGTLIGMGASMGVTIFELLGLSLWLIMNLPSIFRILARAIWTLGLDLGVRLVKAIPTEAINAVDWSHLALSLAVAAGWGAALYIFNATNLVFARSEDD